MPHPVLPFGQGRTYSDTCVNSGGTLIDTSRLDRLVSFDEQDGVLCCESGATLGSILEMSVPRGWFVPVCPGTKNVSVGGAIAHDVHGKNHELAGCFGRYVRRFELLRSSGERLVCSPTDNVELYRATIGGLGLTGLIVWAELQLRPITSPMFDTERIRFSGVGEFFSIAESQKREYTLAWVDSIARGGDRGIFLGGDHASGSKEQLANHRPPRRMGVPAAMPAVLFNRATMRLANVVYRGAQLRKTVRGSAHYEPFLFPQDSVHASNRVYGRRGVFAYQCLIPADRARDVVPEVLKRISRRGMQSLVTVLKIFGDRPSPGMLSFSRRGISMACGFPNDRRPVLRLLAELDEIVREANGLLYPAKDIRMPGESFRASFPQWQEFARHVDPRFSSSFWRRVTASGADGNP